MHVHKILAVFAGLLFTCCARLDEDWVRQAGEITSRLPECAIPCFITTVPDICGSLTNVSCICGSTQLPTLIGPCVASSCNVTESISLARYQWDMCDRPNDRSRMNRGIAVICVMTPLAILLVSLRIFSRSRSDVGLGADDYVMVASLFAYFGLATTVLYMHVNHFGLHTWYMSTWETIEALKLFIVFAYVYLVSITLCKISLLLFFMRIFPGKTFRIVTWSALIFVAVTNCTLMITISFSCMPLRGYWTNWMFKQPQTKCLDSARFAFANAIICVIHDAIIIGLPLPILWKLKLPLQKRISLLLMFSIGLIVVVCSLIRFPTIVHTYDTTDPFYEQAPLTMWTIIECSLAIMCGCLPACRAYFGVVFPKWRMKSQNSNKDSYAQRGIPFASISRPTTRPHKGTFDRSFTELTHKSNEFDDIETRGTISVHSAESKEVCITKTLVPHVDSKKLGVRTRIAVADGSSAIQQSESFENGPRIGIVVKTTMFQSNDRKGETRGNY